MGFLVHFFLVSAPIFNNGTIIQNRSRNQKEMNQKAHVSQEKKNELDRIKKLLTEYKIIALADMTNMPSAQLQRVRSKLKGSALITMSKKRLIKIAIKEVKSKINGVEGLEQYVKGMPAILLTNDSPFRLASALKKE